MTALIVGAALLVLAILTTIFYTRWRGRNRKADKAGGANIVMALLLLGILIVSVGMIFGGALKFGVDFAAGQLK